jgi:hypothetical protein
LRVDCRQLCVLIGRGFIHNSGHSDRTGFAQDDMAAKPPAYKRLNRSVQLGDMIGNTLDPALKRRGFANRDLIAHWAAIAPTPYDKIAMPDKLVWPRRDKPDPEGAVLYVRCVEGHALMLTHDAPMIVSAINRYFGYLLVSGVRHSKTPFTPPRPASAPISTKLSPALEHKLSGAISDIEDEGLRIALEKLGRGVLKKAK